MFLGEREQEEVLLHTLRNGSHGLLERDREQDRERNRIDHKHCSGGAIYGSRPSCKKRLPRGERGLA